MSDKIAEQARDGAPETGERQRHMQELKSEISQLIKELAIIQQNCRDLGMLDDSERPDVLAAG